MTSTPDYNKKLDDLRLRVENHVTVKEPIRSSKMSFIAFNANSPIYYILPPILCLVLLIVFKPSFLTIEVTDSDGNKRNKFSYKRLFLTFLILSIILDIAIFVYFKKTQRD
jgi:hypothetical protein